MIKFFFFFGGGGGGREEWWMGSISKFVLSEDL